MSDSFPEFELLRRAADALESDLDSLSETMNENLKVAGEAPEKYEDFDKVIKDLDNDLVKAKLSFLGYEDALISSLEAAGLLEKVDLPEKIEQGAKNARIAAGAFKDQSDQIANLLGQIMNFDEANERLANFNSTVETLKQELANLTAVALTGDEEQGIVGRLIGGKEFTTEQVDEIRKLVSQIEALKERQKAAEEAQEAANERKAEAIDIISELTNNETDLEEKQRLLTAAIEEFGEKALPNAKKALEEIQVQIKQADPMFQAVRSALQSVSTQISDQFADMVTSGKLSLDSLKDIFSNFVRTMISKAFELMVVNKIINAAFGLTGGSALPTASIGQNAGGGAISGPSIVGERGPELFIPSSTGTIKNNMETKNILGSGRPNVVNQTINIETGVAQTVRAEILSLMPQIQQSTISAMVDARKRGGSMAAAFGA